MSEIDWSKAPEGATHAAFGDSNVPGWYRKEAGCWLFFPAFVGPKAWTKDCSQTPERDRPGFTSRPTAWRGPEDGLPPVGAEVEAWIENRKVWAKVTVLAVDVDTVVWRNGTDRRSYIGTHVNDLRPLKSDKERAVDAAMKVMPYPGSPSTRTDLECAYDAGLLRLPEEQS